MGLKAYWVREGKGRWKREEKEIVGKRDEWIGEIVGKRDYWIGEIVVGKIDSREKR